MYRDPGERISFGDIFQSEHLIDVHVGAETRALGGKPLQRTTVAKIARGNNLELIDPGDPLPVYTPAMSQHPDSFAVLARGSNIKLEAPNRAVLIADSCAADTALVRDREGRRSRGRLLFAPVVPPGKDDDIERLAKEPIFGRFPLAARTEIFPNGAIVELRHCFQVDVRDINAEDRILSLTEEILEDLEVAWNAHALRRGPLATEHVVSDLADLLKEGFSQAEETAHAVLEALNIAWRLEGGSLSDVAESSSLEREKLDRLVADLRELAEAARTAHERLSDGRPG